MTIVNRWIFLIYLWPVTHQVQRKKFRELVFKRTGKATVLNNYGLLSLEDIKTKLSKVVPLTDLRTHPTLNKRYLEAKLGGQWLFYSWWDKIIIWQWYLWMLSLIVRLQPKSRVMHYVSFHKNYHPLGLLKHFFVNLL